MLLIAIAVIFSAIACLIALRANIRLREARRLPMQWWLNGAVTWTAPRWLALAFIPGLAILSFSALIFMSFHMPPRPGQEHMLVPAFIGFGVASVAVQCLHIWLAGKTLARDRG